MRDAMINILICDNDTVFVEEFKSVIIKEFQSNGIKVNVVVVCSSEELFEELKYNIRPDALFIDIELGEENGIDVVSEIRKKDRYLDVVFVSVHDCYYYSAFKQRPIAFLKKPIDAKECKQVLSEIYYERCLENRVFSIKCKSHVVNEKYSDILYVESDRRYLTFYCLDGRSHRMKAHLNDIEKEFKKSDVYFLRIHQSFLVNIRHVHIFEYAQVILSNDVVLPIANERRKQVKKEYFSLCFKE